MVRRCGTFGSIASPLATTRLYRISADLLCRSEGRGREGGEGRGGGRGGGGEVGGEGKGVVH